MKNTDRMRNLSIALFLIASIIGVTAKSSAQNIPIINLKQLETRLSNGADTTYVVNFWATWCGPCVKELPYFEAVEEAYSKQKIRVLLITLDFSENIDSKVVPFVANKELKSDVMLLDESNPNKWIPQVSQEWSGAIPATLFVNTQKKTRHFHEGSFKEGDLELKLQELGLL